MTDRPDFTESAQAVPGGRTQVEGGYTFTRTGPVKEHALPELLIRIGAGARSEVRVGLNSYARTRGDVLDASGFQDSSLGMKFVLTEGDQRFHLSRPAIAVIALATLPTGSRGYRENALQPEAKLCLGWELSEKWSMAGNLNYGRLSEGGEQYGRFSGSLSFGRRLNERWGSYYEVFGFAPGGRDGPNTGYFNTGATYLVTNDYQLDFRVGMGLNGVSDDYFVGAGASRRW